MSETKLMLEIPISDVLKEKEKTKLIDTLILAFKKNDISDVKVVNSYYKEKRALTEPLYLILEITAIGVPIITVLVMAIWAFLKESGNSKSDSSKEINIEVEGLKLSIKGNMTREEIVELVNQVVANGFNHE
ncbi:MAG: hypothetical protein ACFFDI_31280 [Promethearchaeota archaeon]